MTPIQTRHYSVEIPKNHHTFALFDPPQEWVKFRNSEMQLNDLGPKPLKYRIWAPYSVKEEAFQKVGKK